MMEIAFKCPNCQTALVAMPPDGPGDKLDCPECSKSLVIPEPEDESAPPAEVGRLQLKKQEPPAPSSGSTGIPCPKCGVEMKHGSVLCPNCNYNMRGGHQVNEFAKMPEVDSSKWRDPTMVKDLCKWGFGLLLLGAVYFGIGVQLVSTGCAIWGGLLAVVGVLSLVIRRRGMYLVIAGILAFAGVGNALGAFLSGSKGWIIFGGIQIALAVWQVRKYKDFAILQEKG